MSTRMIMKFGVHSDISKNMLHIPQYLLMYVNVSTKYQVSDITMQNEIANLLKFQQQKIHEPMYWPAKLSPKTMKIYLVVWWLDKGEDGFTKDLIQRPEEMPDIFILLHWCVHCHLLRR